jgi:signal transduction histidine kinase
MDDNKQSEYSELLDFINQFPVGLVKSNKAGDIELLNAFGSQILFPLSIYSSCDLSNIKTILNYFDPQLVRQIDSFSPSFGRICEEHRFELQPGESSAKQFYSITINKISDTVYQYALKDISVMVRKEHELQELMEASAMQAGKLEMSTGLLHDIGNAVTAFGTEVAKLKNSLDWRELSDLDKLLNLFSSHESALDQSMGAGKGLAVLKYMRALKNSLAQKNSLLQEGANKLYDNTSHIQDVLNIQRHYVKDKVKNKRELISLFSVVEDALAIQAGIISKRDIKLIKDFVPKLPKIEGDHTRLIQVFINVLKNSAEAFDTISHQEERFIKISLSELTQEGFLLVEVSDNAAGFAPEKAVELFEKGQTSKETGTGFGLYNCKQIIDSHHGEISISSEGIDKGSILKIKLPY